MKKKLWMGVVLAVAFCACAGAVVFADEKTQTNCIGDTSGKTNCLAEPEKDADGEADGSFSIAGNGALDSGKVTVLNFGRIVEAGRRYSQVLTIRNLSKEKKTIRVEAVAYDSDVLDERQKAAVDWLAFGGGKRKFELAANAELQVSVRLMVPADAKGGTYYAKIKVSDGVDEQYVMSKADIALDGFNYGGKVVSQGVGFFNLGEKVTASARLKNEGTGGFVAHYEVQYKNAFGLPEWKQIVESEREVLPGAEEVFEVSEEKEGIGYGFFTVEQKISYVNADGRQVEAVLSHAVVNLPWWGLVIGVGVVVLVIVIVVVMKARKKKKEAERTEAAAKKSTKKAGKKTKKTAEAEEPEEDSDDDFWGE